MTVTREIRVVLADDHPLVLRGLRDLLEVYSHVNVVAMCPDGGAALTAVRELKPDMIVADVSMPVFNGLDILATVIAEKLPTKVVFLTASLADHQIFDAVAQGVHAIVLKDSAPDTLLDCIESVAAGKRWLASKHVGPAIEREVTRRDEGRQLFGSLTSREREIAELTAEGLSNKQIARRLGILEGTAKLHLHNIYQKLGISNRTVLTTMVLVHREPRG
jgi:two-component system nitrate/nitrite response regulator NarL